ncbi:MAG: hypothetical protein IIZ47_07285 [Erysipelotrichaceae bacterium]|nr:hypothetical protein [Erysipelotrichaceae bacterium]
MTDKTITEFNKTDVYNNEIKKKVEELFFLLRIHQIPAFFSACLSNSEEEGSEFVYEAVSPASRGLALKEDRISKHIGVAVGFDVIPSKETMEEDLRDLETREDNGFEGDLSTLLSDDE